MLRIRMGVEAGNRAFANGSLKASMQAFMERVKPEAAYFFPDEGKRSALFVFDMQDASQLPVLVEPFFSALDADVTVTPVMNAEDMQKGVDAAAKTR
jgi:hypothetical protein